MSAYPSRIVSHRGDDRNALPARAGRPCGWDNPLISCIRWVEELVEIAGGEPIFPELRDEKLGRDRIVTPDEVVRRNPEAIVASWCGKAVRKERIAARVEWDRVAAVRDGQIYEIKSAYIL